MSLLDELDAPVAPGYGLEYFERAVGASVIDKYYLITDIKGIDGRGNFLVLGPYVLLLVVQRKKDGKVRAGSGLFTR